MRTDTSRHLVGVVMDSETNNPLFQAPIENPKVSIFLRNFFFGGRISILIKISAFLMSVLAEEAGQCEPCPQSYLSHSGSKVR